MLSMVAPLPLIRVDAWTLRCIFNKRRYIERQHAGEFVFKEKPKPVTEAHRLPPEFKLTVEWFYFDSQTGVKVAHGHYYEKVDGSKTHLDPKGLRVGGQKYGMYEGNSWWAYTRRDPTCRMKRHGLIYTAYVRLRRFTCDRWGW